MSFFNIVAATNEDTVVATYEPSKVRSDSYQSEEEVEKEFIRLLCERGDNALSLFAAAYRVATAFYASRPVRRVVPPLLFRCGVAAVFQ